MRFQHIRREGVQLTFSVQVKSRSMLHHGSVGVSLKIIKTNLKRPTLNLALNVLLPSIVFHNKIKVFIIIFRAYSRLIYYMR